MPWALSVIFLLSSGQAAAKPAASEDSSGAGKTAAEKTDKKLPMKPGKGSNWVQAYDRCAKYKIPKDVCYKKYQYKKCLATGGAKVECGDGKPEKPEEEDRQREIAEQLDARLGEAQREQEEVRRVLRGLQAGGAGQTEEGRRAIDQARRRDLSIQNRIGEISSLRDTVVGEDTVTRDLSESGLERNEMDKAVSEAARLEDPFGDFGRDQDGDLKDGDGSGAWSSPTKGNARSRDPSTPRTRRDLIASANSGFAPVFKRMGMKVASDDNGRARIYNAAGLPASDQEVLALRAQIAKEPSAVMRRPEFFKVLPRKKFEALKVDYVASAGTPDRAYQDIGMTDGNRDFAWTRTCHKLQGGCNPHAAEDRYKKGTDVSPETLDNIHDQTAGEEEGDDDWEWDVDEFLVNVAKKKLPSGDIGQREREGFMTSMMGSVRSLTGGLFGAGNLASRGSTSASASGAGVASEAGESTAQGLRTSEPFNGGPGRKSSRGERGSAWIWFACLILGGVLVKYGLDRRA